MEENNETNLRFPFPDPITSINNIKFSSREIDILACVVGGRTAKKTAFFLSISPRTVENHIRNITLKLECNSRENLIDFVEKSDKVTAIKEHYTKLVLQVEFEKSLKEINQSNHQTLISWLVVEDVSEANKPFIHLLEKHLSLVGINISIRSSKDLKFLLQDASKISSINYMIFLGCKTFLAELNREKPLQKIVSHVKGLLFLSLEESALKEDLDIFTKLDNIFIIKEINYYLLVLEILKNLLQQSNLQKIRERFELMSSPQKSSPFQLFSGKQYPEKKAPPMQHRIDFLKSFFLKKTVRYGPLSVLLIGLLGGCFLGIRETQKEKSYLTSLNQESSIRSDLILPKEDLLLKRPELIAVIDNTLKAREGIQTIALIGTGGAGKTTLARLYARSQNISLIWEINAETHEGLANSFDDLAYALSKTEEDKKNLKELQDIKDPAKKENKIISFVKEKLKNLPGWLLIYDNVENFADIQNYFPRDEGTWGHGQVILTTRNHNVQNNIHVHRSLFIENLNSQQKLDLFSKIMGNGNTPSVSPTRLQETKEFLKTIPSFPLDVSVAAYYIKSTNISYKDYLKSLESPDQRFIDVQTDILKDTSDYIKTRYGIITLSLQRLLSINKDFAELLLFVSLLDSQNLPREMLEKHKDKSIVDHFIYNLKNYSLISNSSEPLSTAPVAFSIHRSTQAISLAYLIQRLKLTGNNSHIQSISDALKQYMNEVRDKKNYRELESLIAHCKAFLNHDLLTSEDRGVISRYLGHIYTYLGDHTRAQKIFEESLHALQQSPNKNYTEIFQTIAFIGNTYREIGHYKKAKELLEQNLSLYQHHLPENHWGLPQALLILGTIYWELGHYEQAKDLLEQSLGMYEKYHSDMPLKAPWALIHLGTVERQLGHYKKAKLLLAKGLAGYQSNLPENHLYLIGPLLFLSNLYEDIGDYEKAKALLEQCQYIQTNDHSGNEVYAAWISGHLGNVYRKLGEHNKAQALLKKSLTLYQKHLPENNRSINWILVNLGDAYKDSGNYTKAKELLEKMLIAYEEYYGNNHIETARVINSLGRVAFLEGDIEAAEGLFNKTSEIFTQNQHPDIYICLEDLSELYQKKTEQTDKAGFITQAQDFKNQAVDYLTQALEIAKTHFPEDSPHAQRIQAKIDKLKELHSPVKTEDDFKSKKSNP